jgi:hypothetical protein
VSRSRAPGRDQWDAAVASGLIRLVAGAVLLRWPAPVARLAGARADDSLARRVVRGFGARDLALAVMTLAATRPGRDVRRALRIQAAADSIDAVIVGGAVAAGRLPKGRGIGGVAIGAVSAAGLAGAAHQLDPG